MWYWIVFSVLEDLGALIETFQTFIIGQDVHRLHIG